ncbi:MAG: guanylate kinase [Methylocystaceae bacterium]
MKTLAVYSDELKVLTPEEEATFTDLYKKVINNRIYQGKLYVLFGPNGAGKTSLAHRLKDFGIPEIISYTTRPIREGEVEGQDYYFVNQDTFRTINMMETTEYEGNYYGTNYDMVISALQAGNCFVIADVDGAKQFKQRLGTMYVQTICIWANKNEVQQRMQQRGDSAAKIERRIRHSLAKGEFDSWKDADHVIINSNLDTAVEHLLRIVIGAV